MQSQQELHAVHVCILSLWNANSGGLWLQASKKMLMENDFLQSLRSFDKDHIPVPVIQKIKPYIANPEFEANKILTVGMHLFCVSVCLCCIACLCLRCVASLRPLLQSSCSDHCH